ncbi:4-hydroxybenzoate octaprenyltransferase [Beggiatoa leptomitoformis]|uniref:4-hydroxybenzoate octaprenyltransferase n=1 Tax=Beggiatoa leptomitoformis TaxID=288004 RepID=A0A2N9YBZ7_9GAMM|nr:4-hydroxybenzoate octaprenyltransferase [Beggiatoa leptomitoformis]ALG66738.1 4-hydroxybenzoate octaprenyltransferase [Beggiatoa leptomitoformis]AUI67924.1 4-hydroxybenzoate octaprenyltransferase [Beggiatoa leptomitoformis]
MNRLREYTILMRLHRPIGIYLLLWATLWAVWIAGQGQPDGLIVLIFITGVVLMRSAGCVINDFADRHIDLHVQRTRDRPLTAGRISSREALLLFITLCLIAFLLVLFLNTKTILLSVGAVFFASLYPFTKRYTYLPQVFLGIAFGWGIPMAFTAQLNELPYSAWLLFLANLSWTVAYDTLYAMADKADDLKIGVKSSAILFGRWDKIIVAGLQLLTLCLLSLTGYLCERGLFFFLGLTVAMGLFIYQHYLIKDRDPSRCLQAFLHNHWVGLVIFFGIVADYW